MLNLYFLGKTEFEYNGVSVTEQFGNKTAALICLLVLNRNKYLSREKIMTYLWPDSNEDAAKYNLRYNLWLIKKKIGVDEAGEQFLYVDKDRCAINERYKFNCDIIDIIKFRPSDEDTIESLQELVNRFSGDFMEGSYFHNCNDFNEIIIFERASFEERHVNILRRLADLYEEAGKMEACEEILKEILNFEPYDEEMAMRIISLYAKMGKRSSAIVYYNNFKNKLIARLGIQPSEELRRKFEEIKESVSEEKDYKNVKYEKSISQREEKPVSAEEEGIIISSGCIKCIQYFWVSDVIDKLFSEERLNCKSYLNERQIADLGYIQPNILDIENEMMETAAVPYVRVVNTFIRLIFLICKEQRITIRISNFEDMDENSRMVYKHLSSGDIVNLRFRW